ncbi:caspase family protein [Sulfurimonas sp. SAG-AH-194-C20]|nr:caspase family protein [Sulfurimonas sp. SAG-AH-194-C20]MDF1878053.1 caspase family protein [Sulfurimonas sp. SAG-AH-194-C20]
MKNTLYLLSILLVLGCSRVPEINAYVPPKQKTKVVYQEKIVYRGSGKASNEETRDAYSHSATQFNFKKNNKINDDAFALIIGINEYKNNTNVEYADYSALAFEKLAQTTLGVPKENIITLLNSDASSGQIKAKIAQIRDLPGEGGVIYLFYAGHGVPAKDGKVYMLPADMSADSIDLEPNLQLDKIYKNLTKSEASNIFIFMDSCFSGKDGKGKLLYKGVAPVLRTSKTEIRNKRLTVMTAGSNSDFANDFKAQEQRLFSYYLIQALSQGNNNLADVYKKIRKQVKRASIRKGIGYKQVPQIYGNSNKKLY